MQDHIAGDGHIGAYTYSWANVASGTYNLSARVVDNRGAVIASATAAVVVAPLALTVTSPAPNASVAADFVLVTGTYTAPANSGVTVNGVVADTDGQGTFFVNNFPLAAGLNTLTITLTTAQGQVSTVTQAVNSPGVAPFQIAAEADVGFAPLTSTIKVANRTGANLVSIAMADIGPGAVDTSGYTPQEIARIAYAASRDLLPALHPRRF